jgi:hypothetical protein
VTRRFSRLLELPIHRLPRREVDRQLPHEQPARTTYKTASTVARLGCIGIRPGDLINGSIGSTISHSHRSGPTDAAAVASRSNTH